MLKLLALVLYFFRELVFDSMEEHDFKSPKFDFKKVALFVILVLSFTLNIFLIDRAFTVASTNIELREKIKTLTEMSSKK